MGDEWPWGRPEYVSWDAAHNQLIGLGANDITASILAAIGTAESSLDLTVLNNTPATGDYSVGAWQINYYGSLLSGRTRAYGSPKALATGGLAKQARAALDIARTSGFGAWSTYNNGAYKAFLHGAPTSPGQPIATAPSVPAPTNPGADSWSADVRQAAEYLAARSRLAHKTAVGISNLKLG